MRKTVNKSPIRKRSYIQFHKKGEKTKVGHANQKESVLNIARDWKIQVDLPGDPVVVPAHIAVTRQRPDIILTSEAVKVLLIIELTCPTESRVEIASVLKRTNYEDGIATAARIKGWRTIIYPVEMGCRGFPAHTMGKMLADLGYQGRVKKSILKKLSTITEDASHFIWKTSGMKTWKTEC